MYVPAHVRNNRSDHPSAILEYTLSYFCRVEPVSAYLVSASQIWDKRFTPYSWYWHSMITIGWVIGLLVLFSLFWNIFTIRSASLNSWQQEENGVHHPVLNALQFEDLAISLRALGLVGNLITAQWMWLVEDREILDMNAYFTVAKTCLTKWTEDAAPLLLPAQPSIFAFNEERWNPEFSPTADQ